MGGSVQPCAKKWQDDGWLSMFHISRYSVGDQDAYQYRVSYILIIVDWSVVSRTLVL